MPDTTERRKLTAVIAVCVAAVVIAAGGAAAIGSMAGRDSDTVVTQEPSGSGVDDATDDGAPDGSGSDDDGEADEGGTEQQDQLQSGDDDMKPSQFGRNVLPEAMGGQEAIEALGDDLERVARLNGKDPEELRTMLLKSSTLKVGANGFLLYVDSSLPTTPSE